MMECDPRGEERLNIFPLFVPTWIIGSIVVRLDGCLEDRPTPYWLDSWPFDDMLKGRPSLCVVRPCLLCNCMALGRRQLRIKLAGLLALLVHEV